MLQIARKAYRNIKIISQKTRLYIAMQRTANTSRIFYLMGLGARFPNLGDQAQAAAIPIWIGKHFNNPIIQVKMECVDDCLRILKANIRSGDIIFLHSGGNFGDDWYETQLMRERIITSMPDIITIQLPQTIYYSHTKQGDLKASKSQDVINRLPSFFIFARDKESETVARKLFTSAIISARPDMVLSLHRVVEVDFGTTILSPINKICRVLLLMRNDKEGVYNESSKLELCSELTSSGYETQIWDTDVNESFPDGSKYRVLKRHLDFIASFDAVVTDRYHGLIFSVLVRRPCIVLKTHNHKLTSAFDWFDDVNFVKRAESNDMIIPLFKELEALETRSSPDWTALHFDPMANEVKNFIAKRKCGG